ncbi:hypothetical protein IW140_000144 [Coemansia sp. RSA 1813]|nr:hypothetical protein EV178_000051 [Coemansia sp. RSA 1646]KAJ1772309.1 hypothetical protein LPJ74_001574 [Coemansia sp. RSA 1843]KAJ2217486.1 hypothetical protein EV179_000320 [Coemansia sp. RSA 487]KAJ2573502.1 hypothetical protein IW140_000144 [Coemansia sp. RSA 1813]
MPVHSDSSVAVLRRGSSHSAAARRSSTRNRTPHRHHLSPAPSGTYRRRLLTQSIHRNSLGSDGTQAFSSAAPLCPFPPVSSDDAQLSQFQARPRNATWFANETELATERVGRSASCCEAQRFTKRPPCASVDCVDGDDKRSGCATDSTDYSARVILRAKRASLHRRTSSVSSLYRGDTGGLSSRGSQKSRHSNKAQRSSSPSLVPARISSFGDVSEGSSMYAQTEGESSMLGLQNLQQSRPMVETTSETASAYMPPAPTPQFLKHLGVRQSDDSLRHRATGKGDGGSINDSAKYASDSENSTYYSIDCARADVSAQKKGPGPHEGLQSGSALSYAHRAPHFTALIKAAHMLNNSSHDNNNDSDDESSTPSTHNVSSRLARFTRRLVDGLSFSRKHNNSSSDVLESNGGGSDDYSMVPQHKIASSLATFGISAAPASAPRCLYAEEEHVPSSIQAPKTTAVECRLNGATTSNAPQRPMQSSSGRNVSGQARRLQAKLAAINSSKMGCKRNNVNLTLPTNKVPPFLPAMMAMPMLSPACASLSAEAVTATGTASSSTRDSPLLRPSSAVALAATAGAAESHADAFFDIAPFDASHQPLSTAPAVAASAHDMLCRLARTRSRSIGNGYSTFKEHERSAMLGLDESPPASLHADVAEEWGLFISHCLRSQADCNQQVPSIDSRSTFIGNAADSSNVPSSPGASFVSAAVIDPSYVLPKRWFSDLGSTEVDKLHTLIAKGIPNEFRRQVWMECAGALDIQPYEAAERAEHVEAIELDLHRTAGRVLRLPPGIDEEAAIRCLRWVLCEYASANPEIGYCQGMNKIAFGLLSAGLNMSDSLLLLRSLLDGGILPANMFRSPLDAVQNDQLVLEELVCRRLPQLSMHMRTRLAGAVPLAPVTVTWFLTLFVDCLPEAHRLRVWDMLFAHGYPAVFQACLGILELSQDALLLCKTPVAFYTLLQDVHRIMVHISEDDFAELAFSRTRPWVTLREIEEIRQQQTRT